MLKLVTDGIYKFRDTIKFRTRSATLEARFGVYVKDYPWKIEQRTIQNKNIPSGGISRR